MTEQEQEHYELCSTADAKKRCLFRCKLYHALATIRNTRESCIVFSTYPLHDLGRMLMEEAIPFRFIHNESSAEDMKEAASGGVILLGPKIPNRFEITANTIISLDTTLSRADKGRLADSAKQYFIVISIPKAGSRSTGESKASSAAK